MNWLRMLISAFVLLGLTHAVNYSLIIPVYADYIYIDDNGVCGGLWPCYYNLSEALESPFIYQNTIFYVFNGTYSEDKIIINKGKALVGESLSANITALRFDIINRGYFFVENISITSDSLLFENISMFYVNSSFESTNKLEFKNVSNMYWDGLLYISNTFSGQFSDIYNASLRPIITLRNYRDGVFDLNDWDNVTWQGSWNLGTYSIFDIWLRDNLKNTLFKDINVSGSSSSSFRLRPKVRYPDYVNVYSDNFTAFGKNVCIFGGVLDIDESCAAAYLFNVTNAKITLVSSDVYILPDFTPGYWGAIIRNSKNIQIIGNSSNNISVENSANVSVLSNGSPSLSVDESDKTKVNGTYQEIAISYSNKTIVSNFSANVLTISNNLESDVLNGEVKERTKILYAFNFTLQEVNSSYVNVLGVGNVNGVKAHYLTMSPGNGQLNVSNTSATIMEINLEEYGKALFENVSGQVVLKNPDGTLQVDHSYLFGPLSGLILDFSSSHPFFEGGYNVSLNNTLLGGLYPYIASDVFPKPSLYNVSRPTECSSLTYSFSKDRVCLLFNEGELINVSFGTNHVFLEPSYGNYSVVCGDYVFYPSNGFETGSLDNWTIKESSFYYYSTYGFVNDSVEGNYSIELNVTSNYNSYIVMFQNVSRDASYVLFAYKSIWGNSSLLFDAGSLVELSPKRNWTYAILPIQTHYVNFSLYGKGNIRLDHIVYLENLSTLCIGENVNLTTKGVVGVHTINVSDNVEGPFYIENPLMNLSGLMYYEGFEKAPLYGYIVEPDGIVKGDFYVVPGILGKGIYTKGGMYFSLDALLNSSDGFTVSFWAKVNPSRNVLNGFLRFKNNVVELNQGYYDRYTLYLPEVIPDKWTMYTFVWNRSEQKFYAYVDGVLVNSTITGTSLSYPSLSVLGGHFYDELFIFSRPLTSTEVEQLYTFVYFPNNVDVSVDGVDVDYGLEGIRRIWINTSLAPGIHTVEVTSPGNSQPSIDYKLPISFYENISDFHYGIYNVSLNTSYGDVLLWSTYWDNDEANVKNVIQLFNDTSLANISLNESSYYFYRFIGEYVFESSNITNNTSISLPSIPNGDFETGDLTGWSTGGDLPWNVQSSVVYNGTYAAQSGAIGNSETSWIELTLTLNISADLVFAWKISTEDSYDYADVYVDGLNVLSESGEFDWTEERIPLSPGTHTIKWSYTRDCCYGGGSNLVWLDNVRLEPSSSSSGDSTLPPNMFVINNFSYLGPTEFIYLIKSNYTELSLRRGNIFPAFNTPYSLLPHVFYINATSIFLQDLKLAKGQAYIEILNRSYELASGCSVSAVPLNNTLVDNGSIRFTLNNYESQPASCAVYINNNLACQFTNITSGSYICDMGLSEGDVSSYNITCVVANYTCEVPTRYFQYFTWADNQSTSRLIYRVNASAGLALIKFPNNYTSAGIGYKVMLVNGTQIEQPFLVLSDTSNVTWMLINLTQTANNSYLILYIRNESNNLLQGSLNVSTLYNYATNASLINHTLRLYPTSSLSIPPSYNWIVVGSLNLLTKWGSVEDSNTIWLGNTSLRYHYNYLTLTNSSGYGQWIHYLWTSLQYSKPTILYKAGPELGMWISKWGNRSVYESWPMSTIHIDSINGSALYLDLQAMFLTNDTISVGDADLYVADVNESLFVYSPDIYENNPYSSLQFYSSYNTLCYIDNTTYYTSVGNNYLSHTFSLGLYNWTLTCDKYQLTGTVIVDDVLVTYLGNTVVTDPEPILRFNVSSLLDDIIACEFGINTSYDTVNMIGRPGIWDVNFNVSQGNNRIYYYCWSVGSDTISGYVDITTDFPPNISIVSPANNSSISSSVFNIEINITDENVSQVRCDVYLNDTFAFSFNNTSSITHPYYLDIAGYYLLNVTCYDEHSNSSALSYFRKTGVSECNSCEECNEKLQNDLYNGVIARVDLYTPSYENACIYLNVSKSLMCDNTYIIGVENQTGVLISSSGQVKGCGLYGFGAGINITSGNPQILQANSSNNIIGLFISGGSPDVQLSQFTFNSLDVYNISSASAVNNICNTYYQWSENGHLGCSYNYLENTTPEIVIYSPQLYVNNSVFNVSFKVNDNYSQQFNCNVTGNLITVTRNELTNATISIPDMEGSHVIWIECIDVSGNLGYVNKTIIYDKTPPNISVFSPINGSVYVGNAVLFNITTSELSDCYILNNTYNNTTHIEGYLMFNPGLYNISILCKDKANNEQTKDVTFEVSNSYLNITPKNDYIEIEAGSQKTLSFNISPQLVSSLNNVVLTVESCPYTCSVYPNAFSILDSLQTFNVSITLPLEESIPDGVVYLKATENTYNTVLTIPIYVNAKSPSLSIDIPNHHIPLDRPMSLTYNVTNIGESPYYNVSLNISCSQGIMCNITNNIPTVLNPNQSIPINVSVYIPYNYTHNKYRPVLIWKSHITTSYKYTYIYTSQPNLVSARYQMLVSNISRSITYTLRNLGQTPALGVITILDCPPGFTCNISPVSFNVNNSINMTFTASQTTAINDAIAKVIMQDKVGRRWITQILLKIAKPNITIEPNTNALSYGLNSILLYINNTGEKESLNATIFVDCNVNCSIDNPQLPPLYANNTTLRNLSINLPLSYPDPVLSANITILEANGRQWKKEILFSVPQPLLSWSFSTYVLPKNTSVVYANITNIGNYVLENATLGIDCPASWVCSNVSPITLNPGQTITVAFNITIPGNYYYPTVILNPYGRNLYKFVQTNATFAILQPDVNITYDYIIGAPGDNISTVINITNVGNWSLEPRILLDLIPPNWTISLNQTALPSLEANETIGINASIHIPDTEILSQKVFRLSIADLYGKNWYEDIKVHVKQPDLSIMVQPVYLDIGPSNITLNITNNGTLDLVDVLPVFVCIDTSAYLINTSVVSLAPNDSILLDAYINVKHAYENCTLYLHNENRTIFKSMVLPVKRLNLSLAHDVPSSLVVGYSGSHIINLTNLEPYAVNFTAYVECLDCESETFQGQLLPNQSSFINFNLTVPINYYSHTYKMYLVALYRGLIEYRYNYSFNVIQPHISISTLSSISMQNNYSGTFTVINNAIPTNASVHLICPNGLLCLVNETNLSLNSGDAVDIAYNISIAGPVGNNELMTILVSTPSKNFTYEVEINIDRGISLQLENKQLYPGETVDLQLNVTNLRSTPTTVMCSVSCPPYWYCVLNETSFNLTTQRNLTLTINVLYSDTATSRQFNILCNAHNVTSIFSYNLSIYQPQPTLSLDTTPINIGENNLTLKVIRDPEMAQYLSLYATCSDAICSINQTTVYTNITHNLSLDIFLPSNYTLPYVNISITATDNSRDYTLFKQVPTNIPSLNIDTQLVYNVPRGQYTTIPIRIINLGLANATNAQLNISCLSVLCNNTDSNINVSAGDIYVHQLSVYKGYELEDGLVTVTIIHENQTFTKTFYVSPLLPALYIVSNNSYAAFQNTTLRIPFTIINMGKDSAINLTASVSCPVGVNCNISFNPGYNLIVGQSRSGYVDVSIPESQPSPFSITLTASEITLASTKTIMITPQVMPTFDTVVPKFIKKQTLDVNATAITVANYGGVNRLVFVNASGVYVYVSRPILLLNETVDAISSGYFDNDTYLDLVVAQRNNISILYSSLNYSKKYNFSTIFPIVALTTLDADGDNVEDLAISTNNNEIGVYINKGYFVKNTSIAINARSLTAYDYDMDGKGDLVAGDPLGQINFIRYPYANITIITPNLHANPNARVIMGDVYASNSTAVIIGDGFGELEYLRMINNTFIKRSLGYFNESIGGLATWDFDQDGDLDLVLLSNGNLSFWETQSIVKKYVRNRGRHLTIEITIINPFLSAMKNVTIEDFWNPGEVIILPSEEVEFSYISHNESKHFSTRMSDFVWTSNRIILPSNLDIQPFSLLKVSYTIKPNTSNPVYYNPKVSYQRVSPTTEPYPYLLSDHIKHTPPYHVINPLYSSKVNVVDGGTVTGNLPDYIPVNLSISDASNRKYVTTFEDPNACLYTCGIRDVICVPDPSGKTNSYGYRYMAYTSTKPLISSSILYSQPVYNSLIFVKATVVNKGEVAGKGIVSFYLNNLRYLDILYNLSVNQSKTYPTTTNPEVLPRGYPLLLGENNVKIVVDPDNIMSELNKSNNILIKQFNISNYSDFVINEVYLADSNGNKLSSIPGGFLGYIVVNVSNLGNTPGYVFLNASLNDSEFYNGRSVGTYLCDYGRKPFLAYVPENNSTLVVMEPIRFKNYNNTVSFKLSVSIYSPLTGYPGDINLSNNIPKSYMFNVVPSPPELDFYNSTKQGDLGNYTLQPHNGNNLHVDLIELGKLENISLDVWNLGGVPATVNVSVYLDVFNGSTVLKNYTRDVYRDRFNAGIWDEIAVKTPIYRSTVTIPSGKHRLYINGTFNFSYDKFHTIVIVLDPIGNEDNISNIYVIRYVPPDIKLKISQNENPLGGTVSEVYYNISCDDLADPRYDYDGIIFGSSRYSDHLRRTGEGIPLTHPVNVSLKAYLNHTLVFETTIPGLCNSHISYNESMFYINLPTHYRNISFDAVVDPDILSGDINLVNNLYNISLLEPSFRNLSMEIENDLLLADAVNRIILRFNTSGGCLNIDHISLYLKENGTWYLLYSKGEFAKKYNTPGWLTICDEDEHAFNVYVPNISKNNAEIYVIVLTGYKAITPKPILDLANFSIPVYDMLWYMPDRLPLKVNDIPILVSENYPHVGNFTPNTILTANQRLTLYLYKRIVYNKSVVISHAAPIEVSIS